MKRTSVLLAVVAFCCIGSSASAMWSVANQGLWPKTWPAELEYLRAQARTLDGGMSVESRYEIPFTARDQFLAAWPHLLAVKSKSAPIVLVRGPYSHMGKSIPAGVIVHSPPTGSAERPLPEKPLEGPWPEVRSRWQFSIYLELVVDGDTVDLNRIPLPEGTPIFDRRFVDGEGGRSAAPAQGSAATTPGGAPVERSALAAPAAMAAPAAELPSMRRPVSDGAKPAALPLRFKPPIRNITADSVENGPTGLVLKGNVRMRMNSTEGDGIIMDVTAKSVTISSAGPLAIEALQSAITYREKDNRPLAVIEGEQMTIRQAD